MDGLLERLLGRGEVFRVAQAAEGDILKQFAAERVGSLDAETAMRLSESPTVPPTAVTPGSGGAAHAFHALTGNSPSPRSPHAASVLSDGGGGQTTRPYAPARWNDSPQRRQLCAHCCMSWSSPKRSQSSAHRSQTDAQTPQTWPWKAELRAMKSAQSSRRPMCFASA